MKKNLGEMGWKVAAAPAPVPVPVPAPAKKRGWGPVPKAPAPPWELPEVVPPATNYWDWLPEELQDEVHSHNVLRGLCGMPDWVAGGGPRVRYCVPAPMYGAYEEMVYYNNQGGDPTKTLPMPGGTPTRVPRPMPGMEGGTREPQMVAVPPPEFWDSIHHEVERMGMGRTVRNAWHSDFAPGAIRHQEDMEWVQAYPRPLDPTESPVILKNCALNDFDGLDGAWSEGEFHMWKLCLGDESNDFGDANQREQHEPRRAECYSREDRYAHAFCKLPSSGRYPGKPYYDANRAAMACFRLQTDPATLHLFWLDTPSDRWHSDLQIQAARDAETLRRYGAHGPWNKGVPEDRCAGVATAGSMDEWLANYYDDIDKEESEAYKLSVFVAGGMCVRVLGEQFEDHDEEPDDEKEPAWAAEFRSMAALVEAEAEAEAHWSAEEQADDAYWSEQALGVADVHVHAVHRGGVGRGGHTLERRGALMLGDDSRSRPKALFG